MPLAAGFTPSVELAVLNTVKSINGLRTLARSKNIPVGGPQLIEKAKMITAALDNSEFKGLQGCGRKDFLSSS